MFFRYKLLRAACAAAAVVLSAAPIEALRMDSDSERGEESVPKLKTGTKEYYEKIIEDKD